MLIGIGPCPILVKWVAKQVSISEGVAPILIFRILEVLEMIVLVLHRVIAEI